MGDGAMGFYEDGIYRSGDVRISDLSGRKMLPIGDDTFATCVSNSVFIDKIQLILGGSGKLRIISCKVLDVVI